jgi:hypothetical protein
MTAVLLRMAICGSAHVLFLLPASGNLAALSFLAVLRMTPLCYMCVMYDCSDNFNYMALQTMGTLIPDATAWASPEAKKSGFSVLKR